MLLDTLTYSSPMTGMGSLSPWARGPAVMMGAQQQMFATMMMGMLSTLFQELFGGGEMAGGGVLPSAPGFGSGRANGLDSFLGLAGGAPSSAPGLAGAGGGRRPPTAAASQPGGEATFEVASFNVLGSSHTAAGGNKPGMASGVARTRGAVAAMRKHGVDIAGMQEFQGDQQKAFQRLAPEFGVVGERDNAIVYNQKKFRLLKKDSFIIPYFEGNKRQMPIALLEDKKTGKRVWVVNIHNPADTKDHPHNAANRAKAISAEQQLMRKLQATGYPVLLTGDFNARVGVDQSMARAGMDSAAPGKARSEIDYIFGSAGVDFSHYAADHGLQRNGTSDHPLIVSSATI